MDASATSPTSLFDDIHECTDHDTGHFQTPAVIVNNPESLPPFSPPQPTKLLLGLHKAQCAADTTAKDFDTAARAALRAGGITVLMLGWTLVKNDNGYSVSVPVTVMHKSGEAMPGYTVTMPVRTGGAESVPATLSALRRCVIGQLLNIDPEPCSVLEPLTVEPDEAESPPALSPAESEPSPISQPSDCPPKRASWALPQKHNPIVQSTARPKPQDASGEARESAGPIVPDVVKNAARDAISMLKARFGHQTLDAAYQIATGKTDPWPSAPETLDFMAISQLASACEISGEHIDSHEGFFKIAKAHPKSIGSPFFQDGEATAFGLKAKRAIEKDG